MDAGTDSKLVPSGSQGDVAMRVQQAGDITRVVDDQMWPGLSPEPWGRAVLSLRRNRPHAGHHGWGLLGVEGSTPTSNRGSPKTEPCRIPIAQVVEVT